MNEQQVQNLIERMKNVVFREKRESCVCGWRFTCANCRKQGKTWEQTDGRNR